MLKNVNKGPVSSLVGNSGQLGFTSPSLPPPLSSLLATVVGGRPDYRGGGEASLPPPPQSLLLSIGNAPRVWTNLVRPTLQCCEWISCVAPHGDTASPRFSRALFPFLEVLLWVCPLHLGPRVKTLVWFAGPRGDDVSASFPS